MKAKHLIGLLLLVASCNNPIKQPNVLFIAVDDLRPELGIYGNSIMVTPNLDKLGAEGSVFTNHYVQVPTCGASRLALLTGMRPSKRRHLSNQAIVTEISNNPDRNNPETFIHALKNNGYYTVGIGKISHSADGLVYGYNEQPSSKKELPHSWDELLFNSGKWKTGWNAFFGYADGENRQSMKRQVTPYEMGNTDDLGYPDGLTTQLVVEKLKFLKKNEKPFFLGVGYFKPHLPFNAPKKYWDMYNRNDIPIAETQSIPEHTNPKHLQPSNEFNGYLLTDEKITLDKPASTAYQKKLKHAYYASVSYIDAQIGIVLQTLKEQGLDDNTIVIVWGDHGWHLGDQRVWGKHTLYDIALRSALIVKVPDKKQAVGTVNTIVETVDIYPTIMELCGITETPKTDGINFSELLNKDKSNKKEVAYSYFRNGISVKTQRYRLTKYYNDDVVYLFDHKSDPEESANIATKNPDIVAELLPLLEKGNTGLYSTEDSN